MPTPSPDSPSPAPASQKAHAAGPATHPAARRPSTLAVVALLVAAAVGGLLAHRASEAAPATARPAEDFLNVRPYEVVAEPGYAVTERYVGRVSARRVSHLGFTASGLLVEVLVDEGDAVEAGQLLARLDRDALDASRRELAAQVDEIDARLALAKLSLGRTKTLAGKDSASKSSTTRRGSRSQRCGRGTSPPRPPSRGSTCRSSALPCAPPTTGASWPAAQTRARSSRRARRCCG